MYAIPNKLTIAIISNTLTLSFWCGKNYIVVFRTLPLFKIYQGYYYISILNMLLAKPIISQKIFRFEMKSVKTLVTAFSLNYPHIQNISLKYCTQTPILL